MGAREGFEEDEARLIAEDGAERLLDFQGSRLRPAPTPKPLTPTPGEANACGVRGAAAPLDLPLDPVQGSRLRPGPTTKKNESEPLRAVLIIFHGLGEGSCCPFNSKPQCLNHQRVVRETAADCKP